MKIEGLNYYSSYIITEHSFDNVLEDFKKISLNKLNIYYDKNIEVTTAVENNDRLTLIGYCFDIRDSSKNQNIVLTSLLMAGNLHEELDYINGRYILILTRSDNHYIYSDALQLRPLVYHKESGSLASHDSLLNNVLKKTKYNISSPSLGKNNSLDYTQYNEIYKYNPNLYLNYNEFKFIRFYPRREIENKASEQVFLEIKPYLDQISRYLMNVKNNVFLTITGGIDSRVSASLTRDFSNKIEYLTYTKQKEKLDTPLKKLVYRNDESITSEMKRYLGWNHRIIDLDDYKPTKEEISDYLKVFNSRHAYSLINYYRYYRGYYKALHIKSTGFGMGKADFPKNLDEKTDTFEFYEKCLDGLKSGFKNRRDYKKKVKEYFKRNKVLEGFTYGRHYHDLFHLESRMGNWHSTLTLETDPETEEFIIMNSRKLIDLIMQPSINERRNHELYKIIINYYWPVLLKFGVNKIEENIEHKKTLGLPNIKVLEINKVQLNIQDNAILAIPDVKIISNLEMHTFGITGKVGTKLIIRSYYKNEKGRNKIKVIVKEGMEINIYDILDINNGLSLEVSEKGVSISIVYNHDYTQSSWIHAGRLTIEKQ